MLYQCVIKNQHAEISRVAQASPGLVNQGDEIGRTVLFDAIERADIAVIELLLTLGAEPGHTTFDGWTPIDEAIRCQRIDVIPCLVVHGADMSERQLWDAITLSFKQNKLILWYATKLVQADFSLLLEPKLRFIECYLINGHYEELAEIIALFDCADIHWLALIFSYGDCELCRTHSTAEDWASWDSDTLNNHLQYLMRFNDKFWFVALQDSQVDSLDVATIEGIILACYHYQWPRELEWLVEKLKNSSFSLTATALLSLANAPAYLQLLTAFVEPKVINSALDNLYTAATTLNNSSGSDWGQAPRGYTRWDGCYARDYRASAKQLHTLISLFNPSVIKVDGVLLALYADDIELFKLAFDSCSAINTLSLYGHALLVECCGIGWGNPYAFIVLERRDVDIDIYDLTETTAIFAACTTEYDIYQRKLALIKMLVDLGADCNVLTPSHKAGIEIRYQQYKKPIKDVFAYREDIAVLLNNVND